MNTTIELLTRILCDTRPNDPVDGAYLYCTTIDNQAAVFRTARVLISHCIASRIFILGAEAMSGYPGVIEYQKGLQASDLSEEQIELVPYGNATSINTLIESQALVRFAREKRLGSLILVSPPFHQLRAFMTAVTVALNVYPQLLIYSHPGSTLPWLEPVAHSQGTLTAPRRQLIQEELIRIRTYQDKGDLARFADVLGYMNRRDA